MANELAGIEGQPVKVWKASVIDTATNVHQERSLKPTNKAFRLRLVMHPEPALVTTCG